MILRMRQSTELLGDYGEYDSDKLLQYWCTHMKEVE